MKKIGLLLSVMMFLGGCHHQTTYAEGCGGLPANWITPRDGRGVMSLLSVIVVRADGSLQWNRIRVSDATLKAYLKETATLNPVPVVQIKFAPDVDCNTVARLRQLVSETLDCKFGQCAEGSGKWWRIGDVGPPFEAYDPQPTLLQKQ
ncbi:ExbD/TolR family protein [Sphingomonas sp. MMS24-J45]|uniref:ExbD/TolR family protein n=1 Tax=Sphingomonas sp. MMS24-J45 TaxID=3238806 RepID=UPI00385120DE